MRSRRVAHLVASHPTDLAVIEDYLRPWLTFDRAPPPSAPFVHVADIYGAGPTELTARFAPAVSRGGGGRAWYFLTLLRPMFGKGIRFARVVDTRDGWWWRWRCQSSERPVVDAGAAPGGKQVGRCQDFSFRRIVDRVRTGWIMRALRVGCGDGGLKEEVRVLCKVYRNPRLPADPSYSEPTAVHSREGAEEDEDDGCASSAAAAPVPGGRDEKAVNSEGYGGTSVVLALPAPAREREPADGESSVAARKRPHAEDGDEQSSDAAGSKRRKTEGADTDSSGAPATAPHCPQDAAQAGVVAVAESEILDPLRLAILVPGDSAVRAHIFYHFF